MPGQTAWMGFSAPTGVERDALVLDQIAMTGALDGREVHEDIRGPVVGNDHAEPLAALNHFTVPSATAVPFSTLQHLREIPGNRQRQTTCVIRSRPMPSILAAEPPAAMIPGRIFATTPALPSWKAGVVPRLFAPREGWIGTLDTAHDAAIFTTGPGTPGRLSSVRFEVQPHSDDTKSSDDPASGRRSAQVRLTRYLTSLGRTTLSYDYGPFVSTGIGPKAKSSGWSSE
jgi:hypothetical protein